MAMRPGAWLVNVARAGLVDRAALEAALAAGRLGGVAFDVFWSEPANPSDPLLRHPDFILTPHLAGFTREAEDRLLAATADNIRRVARGEAPAHQVGET
jgi:phosphoglycerate dehydrogenase-like enzyme